LRSEPLTVLEIWEAWERVAAHTAPLPAERVALADAAWRIAAEDAPSAVDLPPFDRSAMDGYAVRAADVAPGVALRLAGEVAAGEEAGAPLDPGTAMGITTGAALPAGADAILRVEDARLEPVSDPPTGGDRAAGTGHVVPTAPVHPGLHVRYRGEDVRAGAVLAPAGARLDVARITALASAGVGEVAVHRRARVHVIATGSELLPVGAPPEPGRIHESNRLTLRLLAEHLGAGVTVHPVVADDPEATRAAVEAGLAGDVLAVTGGVSVGAHDHVKPAFEACGVEELFWRVRLKPGKPLWFGRRGGTLVFGLPGNPLSTLACFLLFLGPAVRRLQGEAGAAPRYDRATLSAPASAEDGRTTLLTAVLTPGPDGGLLAAPTERQGSHLTGTLAGTHGFVVAPHDAGTMAAGTAVDVVRLP
jgi:molybdopterin molybdotransferase